MSNNDNKQNCFNLVRLVAAFQVMCGHAIEHIEVDIPNVLSFFEGVPIFFALSGFLIWFSVGRTTNYREFLKKRFWRIYPELWMGICLEAIVLVCLYRVEEIFEFILFIIGQASVFQFWTPTSLRGYGCGTPNGSLWTICVLIQFYIVVWWIYKILHGKSFWVWLGVWSGLLLGSNFIHDLVGKFLPEILNKLYDQTVVRYLWLFMLGCICAEYFDEILPYLKKYWYICFVLGAIFYFTGFDLQVHYNVFHSMFLFVGILGFSYSFPKLQIKRDISYGIYIYHMTVVNAMLVYNMKHKVESVILVCAISCVLAIASSHITEKIKFKWRK